MFVFASGKRLLRLITVPPVFFLEKKRKAIREQKNCFQVEIKSP